MNLSQRSRSMMLFVTAAIAFASSACNAPAGRPGERLAAAETELEPAFDAHELSCLEAPGSVEHLGTVRGAGESELVLHVGAGCRSRLAIRAGGLETVIDATPRIRMFATGTRLDAGGMVVCQTSLSTTPTVRTDPEGATIHHIDAASIECFVQTDDGWFVGPSTVVPDTGAAAWLTDVDADGSLRWLRDSTYDIGNLVRDGRPVSDGLWAGNLALTSDRRVAMESPIQESPMPFGRDGYDEM